MKKALLILLTAVVASIASAQSTTPQYMTTAGGTITGPMKYSSPLQACPVFEAPGQYCILSSPFYASGSSQSTTTTGTNPGSTTINVASCIDFTAASAGKRYSHEGVYIAGAGAAGADYVGTATACSSNVLTVSPATTTSVSVGTLVLHDESAAFNAAVTLANGASATTIIVPDGTYNVNGAFQQASGANAIIALPSVAYIGSPITAPYVLAIRGLSPPTMGGATAAGAVIQTRKTATSGAVYFGSILGAWATSTGFGAITNVDLTLENLTFRTYDNPNITAVNGDGLASLNVRNVNIDTGLAMNCGYGVGGACNGAGTAPTTPTHASSAGIITPQGNNYGDPKLTKMFITGYYTGIKPQEHATLDDVFVRFGVECINWNIVGHGATGYRVNTEHCTHGMSGSTYPNSGVFVASWSFENNTVDLYDPTSAMTGTVFYEGFLATMTQTGGYHLRTVNLGAGNNQYFNITSGFGPYSTGGTFYTWNLSGSLGESDFVNHTAAASPGGFDWLTLSTANQVAKTLMHIDYVNSLHIGVYDGVTDNATGAVYLGDLITRNSYVGIWRGKNDGTTVAGNTLNVDGYDGLRLNVGAFGAGLKTNVMTCVTASCLFAVPVTALKIGTSGTTLSQATIFSPTVTTSAVAANTCADTSVTMSGIVLSDNIGSYQPPSTMGNFSLNIWATGSNSLAFHFCNNSVASATPPAGVYRIMAIH